MAHDVFISYSHKDQTVANAIVAGLETEGIRCWIAPRDVTPGKTWGDAIVEAIEGAEIMVMVLSENSNRSRQVLREVERAAANEVIIIPFRIENIDPTGAMAYFISTEHWLDALTPPLENHIQKLTRTITLFLSGEQAAMETIRTPVAHKPTKAKKIQKWIVPSLIGLLAISVIAILAFILIPSLQPQDSEIGSGLQPDTETKTSLVLNPTPTQSPKLEMVGEYRTSRAAEGLYVAENTLYLANGMDNLMRINVSNPANPMPLDVYSAYNAQEVVVENDVAYILMGEDTREFLIIDYQNDESYLFSSSNTDINWSFSHLAVQDKLVHITDHNYWGIIDLHDPSNPEELWRWEPSTNSGVTCQVVLEEEIAYIGGGWTGLHIFDVSDPRNPKLIGGFDTSNWIVGMSLADDILYLSLGESGLLALDVHDPSNPLMLDVLELPGNITNTSAAKGILYVIYNVLEDYNVTESGVIAVDVSDPENLTILAKYDNLHEASDIQAVEDAVFVTDRPWGLVVLALDTPKSD